MSCQVWEAEHGRVRRTALGTGRGHAYLRSTEQCDVPGKSARDVH
jgi:hypothetical protein